MTLRILDTGLRPARWNVAMSAALLASVDEGSAPPTLRFHRFEPSCVLGRNQRAEIELDLVACRAGGIAVARRSTGGGAVVMGPGVLAFDLVVPGRPDHIGRRVASALVQALASLGVTAAATGTGSISIGGLKVSGSAGRLAQHAYLHQATLILDLDEAPPLSLLRRRTEGGRPTADPTHRVTDLRAQSGGTSGSIRNEVPGRLVEVLSSGFELRLPSAADHGKHSGRHAEKRPQGVDRVTDREMGLARDLLARRFGRDDYVFDRDWSEAA